jgi:site-specific recombinase XerD
MHDERARKRVTKRYPSHMVRNFRKRKRARIITTTRPYSEHSYRIAVARAVKTANAVGLAEAKAAGRESEFKPIPHWHPNQLRHTFATKVRKSFGLEGAQVLLGHNRADTTQIYAEKNTELAAAIAAKIG